MIYIKYNKNSMIVLDVTNDSLVAPVMTTDEDIVEIDMSWKDINDNTLSIDSFKYCIPNFSKIVIHNPHLVEVIPFSVLLIDEEYQNIISHQLGNVRTYRNYLLNQSDWTVLSDVSMTEEKKKEWVDYRQKLRDITNEYLNPYLVKWPDMPI